MFKHADLQPLTAVNSVLCILMGRRLHQYDVKLRPDARFIYLFIFEYVFQKVTKLVDIQLLNQSLLLIDGS